MYVQHLFPEKQRPILPIIQNRPFGKRQYQTGLIVDVGLGAKHLHDSFDDDMNLDWYALDFAADLFDMTPNNNTDQTQLVNRFYVISGDAQCLPFLSATFDIVISRGSLIFWADERLGFSEIYRVLRPGGSAYVGCGMGRDAMIKQFSRLTQRVSTDSIPFHQNLTSGKQATAAQRNSGKRSALKIDIIDDESGAWVYLEKEADPMGQFTASSICRFMPYAAINPRCLSHIGRNGLDGKG